MLVLVATFFTFGKIALADPITDPTHFDDTYWYFPTNPSGYTQISTNITPIVDGSPDGYYFSSYFLLTNNPGGYGGYLGLQTEGSQPTGKIAIFSIWGATASSGPGYNASGTESGQTYYTSRIQYQWVINNTYVTNVYLSSQASGDNTWTATVTDQNTGVQSLIGNIVTPASFGNMQNELVTFHERYSGPTASCSDMQESEVEFTDIRASNGSVAPISQTNEGPSNSACASDFSTQNISNGIETIVGGQLPPTATTPAPTPTPVKKTPTPTPTTTPVVTPAVTTPSTTNTTNQTKPAKPITTTLNLKTSNKSKPLSLGLAATYTAGIGIPIILIILGIAFFERFLPRRRKLASLSNNPGIHLSPEIVVSSSSVEPTTNSYPQMPTMPLVPNTPPTNPLPTNSVSVPPQPTIVNPTNPQVESPKE